jgi:DNA-binding NarL/FixJ family response regulator
VSVRVLIVDDATYVRRMIGELIVEHNTGWCVAGEASNGEEAIEVAPQVRPDLVLLDLSMPVMDGLEALPHLRREVPDAAVVVLTGFPSEVARQAAVDAGAHGYLEKDALVASLIPRLEAILDEVRAHVASSGSPQAS